MSICACILRIPADRFEDLTCTLESAVVVEQDRHTWLVYAAVHDGGSMGEQVSAVVGSCVVLPDDKEFPAATQSSKYFQDIHPTQTWCFEITFAPAREQYFGRINFPVGGRELC